jgi:hypothetical protein
MVPHQFSLTHNNNNNNNNKNSPNSNNGNSYSNSNQNNGNLQTDAVPFQQQQQQYPKLGTSLPNHHTTVTTHENLYPNSFQKHSFNLNSNNNNNQPLPFSTQRSVQNNMYTQQSTLEPRIPLLTHPLSQAQNSGLSLQAHQQKAQGFKLATQQQQQQQQQDLQQQQRIQIQQVQQHQQQQKQQQQQQHRDVSIILPFFCAWLTNFSIQILHSNYPNAIFPTPNHLTPKNPILSDQCETLSDGGEHCNYPTVFYLCLPATVFSTNISLKKLMFWNKWNNLHSQHPI